MGKLLKKVMSEPLLQVALDFTSIENALKVLRKILDTSVGIVEVGTPLIKAEGMKSVSIIKSLINNDKLLLADTKTADVGGIEARLAGSHGADAMTVLGLSEDAVIESSISECNKLGIDVVVDLIGLHPKRVTERVSELYDMGVRIINLHVGIDVQRKYGVTATALINIIRELNNKFNDLIISVSGGIKPENVKSFVSCGARIIVIGSAITKAENPREATLKALRGLRG